MIRCLLVAFLAATAFAQSNQIAVVVPYEGAARLVRYWAVGESQVDWQKDGLDAERCTTAFAATELKSFLERTAPKLQFRFVEKVPATGPAIVVGTAVREAGVHFQNAQAYAIRSVKRDGRDVLYLTGGGRAGTLYAVYAFLDQLGWRWYAPGTNGEVAPAERTSVTLSGWNIQSAPDFPLFRGFHAAADSMESVQVFQWMARNRLNMWAYCPRSYHLMKKLGFVLLSGGHILEQVLDPDKPMASGKTLFEEHPDWFAEVNGKRERKNAYRYQFCVSNDEAAAYVARSVVEHLASDWRWTDYQNVWLFDTWAGWCQCPRCRALGNDADRYLHLMARIRREAAAAVASGKMPRDIGMALVAYEGTPSLGGPSREIPELLSSGKDFSLYAPINRCYAHTLESRECTELNEKYARTVSEWGRVSKRFPLAVVEYYNVSKFEDLPLLFSRTMGADFAFYHRIGVTGMSYMHIPMALWGPRALTQVLFARLSWDAHAPVEKIKDEYLRLYYGPASAEARTFYDKLEAAYANITAWRSWYQPSVNGVLRNWDGQRPTKPLFTLKHLSAEDGLAVGPRESLRLLDEAKAALDRAMRVETPLEIRLRLEEDARAFRYGDDSFRFYWALARLYEADRLGQTAGRDAAWRDLEATANSLATYYVPFDFDAAGPHVSAKDGLARTQMRPLYEKLRARFASKHN
jgi:hypothetical protein